MRSYLSFTARQRAAFFILLLLPGLQACGDGSVGHETIKRCYPEGACDQGMFQAGIRSELGNAEHGMALYKQQCASCHGSEGKGTTTTVGIDFTSPIWHARFKDGQLAARIIAGKPPMMPSFNIQESKLRDLVAYLRSLRVAPPSQRPDGSGY